MRGLAQAAHDTGVSIWRALAVEFPTDDAVWPVADEVMVGGGVLVAPVQAAGETSRSVYLPPGTWFPWAGGPSVAGRYDVDGAGPRVGDPGLRRWRATIVPTYPAGVETLDDRALERRRERARVGDDRIVYAFAGRERLVHGVARLGRARRTRSPGSLRRAHVERRRRSSRVEPPRLPPCATRLPVW